MAARGEDILRLARKHLGEKYALGVLVPKNNPQWKGSWDCAEFASWLVYQTSGILYGCDKSTGDPATADAYSGYWAEDAKSRGIKVEVGEAARTPGAAILRAPQDSSGGHVVISDGTGGTVEAHSTKKGVIEAGLSNRRWDFGILVPSIAYTEKSGEVEVDLPPTTIYRLQVPWMAGAKVKEIQRALKNSGSNPGPLDSEFGPMTQAAVIAFQIGRGLVPDGEVGPITAKALGIVL